MFGKCKFFCICFVIFNLAFHCFCLPAWSQNDNKFDSKAVEIGKKTVRIFMSRLVSALDTIMKNQGVAEALAQYEDKIAEITKSIKDEMNQEIGIKLLSPRYRDVKNSPDYYEEQAYKDFLEAWHGKGRCPPYVIQEIRRDGKVFYRYYEPLFITNMCLKCHGSLESLDLEAAKRIKQDHPNDNAVGYRLGDLRGFIRITIPQTYIAQ